MNHFRINVSYDRVTRFHYKDEGGADATVKKHCYGGDIIRWHLNDAGPTTLKVEFPDSKDGNPFEPSTPLPLPDRDYTFNDKHKHKHKHCYKYTVRIMDAGGNEIDHDDPQIIFDDVTVVSEVALIGNALDELGAAAQKAFQGLLADMKDTEGLKRDPNAFFFPGGINNIQVQVTVLGVPIAITVSGPAPGTGIASASEAKK